jgi:hypothetical protein
MSTPSTIGAEPVGFRRGYHAEIDAGSRVALYVGSALQAADQPGMGGKLPLAGDELEYSEELDRGAAAGYA